MFFIYRKSLLDDLDSDKREINKEFDFAILNKEEFKNLSDDEKIQYCYGITKGFQNEYTINTYIDEDDIDEDDPYLLDWIVNLLKEEELYEEFFYSYLSENFEEEYKVSISKFESNSDEKWDAACETWDKVTDEVGLYHYYLWAINKIYSFSKYLKVLETTASECNERYESLCLIREQRKIHHRKRIEGIYNQLIKKNRSIWDDYIKEEKLSFPPSANFQNKYPKDLSEDEKEAFEVYLELIYWNKEMKSPSGRKKTFKDYPDVNF